MGDKANSKHVMIQITREDTGHYATKKCRREQKEQQMANLMHVFNSLPRYGAFDLGLAVSVPLPIVTGIFVLLWFQSRLT